jgi:hypothetical protein
MGQENLQLLQALLDQEADQVDDAVGVAPLVVVPADDLDAVADDLGQLGASKMEERGSPLKSELTSRFFGRSPGCP